MVVGLQKRGSYDSVSFNASAMATDIATDFHNLLPVYPISDI